jgi:hypothetical protein
MAKEVPKFIKENNIILILDDDKSVRENQCRDFFETFGIVIPNSNSRYYRLEYGVHEGNDSRLKFYHDHYPNHVFITFNELMIKIGPQALSTPELYQPQEGEIVCYCNSICRYYPDKLQGILKFNERKYTKYAYNFDTPKNVEPTNSYLKSWYEACEDVGGFVEPPKFREGEVIAGVVVQEIRYCLRSGYKYRNSLGCYYLESELTHRMRMQHVSTLVPTFDSTAVDKSTDILQWELDDRFAVSNNYGPDDLTFPQSDVNLLKSKSNRLDDYIFNKLSEENQNKVNNEFTIQTRRILDIF